jgi:hypothetical protein
VPKKTIETLIPDIYGVLGNNHKGTLMPKALDLFGEASVLTFHRAIESPERGPRPNRTIYASELRDFEVCPRKMWYKIHTPEKAETLLPHNRIKFLYGDLTEAMLIFLAEQAGHEVEGLQKGFEEHVSQYNINIRGRIDCTIDGVLVDVKSASSPAFKRMTSSSYSFDDDMFSYHRQLQWYDGEMTGPDEDPVLLMMDKQLGTLALKSVPSWSSLGVGGKLQLEFDRIHETAGQVFDAEAPPLPSSLWVGDEPQSGTSPNRKLKTYCSYCPFKSTCWEDLGKPLTGYLYSYGPVWLTEVNKTPNVPEIR